TILKGMSNTTWNPNIYAPVIACLSLALLMSVVINIYWICMKRNREVGQRCYNLVTCRGTLRTMQQDGRIEEQTEAEKDVQYAALNFLKQKEKTERKKTRTEPGEILYSDLETCRSTHRTIEQDARVAMQ
ncbi:RNA-directed RNA polymerase L, partial [Clarias magur]